MKKSMIALAVLMSMASFAHASAQECNGSTYDMRICLDTQLQKADKELNAVYKQALNVTKQFDVEVQERLVKAEKAWIPFRDASCELEAAQMLGGTGETVIQLGCLVDKTQKRTKELNDIIKNFSGM